jgi:hypothetical protein
VPLASQPTTGHRINPITSTHCPDDASWLSKPASLNRSIDSHTSIGASGVLKFGTAEQMRGRRNLSSPEALPCGKDAKHMEDKVGSLPELSIDAQLNSLLTR